MRQKKRSAKNFRKLANQFLSVKNRIDLLVSISAHKKNWVSWVSEIKGCLKNLDEGDYNKFSALADEVERNFNEQSRQVLDLLSFLIEKEKSYRDYDFYTKEERKEQRSFRRRIIEKILSIFELVKHFFHVK